MAINKIINFERAINQKLFFTRQSVNAIVLQSYITASICYAQQKLDFIGAEKSDFNASNLGIRQPVSSKTVQSFQ